MAPATVTWFVVLDGDGELVRETTYLDEAIRAKRSAGPGAVIRQEKRAAGERMVQHFGAAS